MLFKFYYDISKCYFLLRDCFFMVFKIYICFIYIVFDGYCFELLYFSKSMLLLICKLYLFSIFVYV